MKPTPFELNKKTVKNKTDYALVSCSEHKDFCRFGCEHKIKAAVAWRGQWKPFVNLSMTNCEDCNTHHEVLFMRALDEDKDLVKVVCNKCLKEVTWPDLYPKTDGSLIVCGCKDCVSGKMCKTAKILYKKAVKSE